MINLGHLALLAQGLAMTLIVAVGAAALAILLAFTAAVGRRSRSRALRICSFVYIEIFRGTSAFVQLFWFYFVLPLFGIELNAVIVGVVVLGLNIGAYGAEVIRGALSAVPAGQREAAMALNLSDRQRFWLVTLPQAAPFMIPPWCNLFIELLKSTALVSLITINELAFQAQIIRSETLLTVPVYAMTLVLYFAVALLVATGMRRLERRFTEWRSPMEVQVG